MARSQRHRIEVQGVHADERRGTIPTVGTYNGSHLRAGATAGAAVRGRAGGSSAQDGVGGPGTRVAGYVGVVTAGGAPRAEAGNVDGYIAPVYKRASA
jgi:hypothetical protein